MQEATTREAAEQQDKNSRGRAVVTGASSGIGAATVRSLSARGWRVVALARRRERLEALARETGCEVVVVDLTDREAVAAACGRIMEDGPVHALVNNAGGAFGADSVEQGDPEDWLSMFNINVMGTLHITQALLPALRESGRGDLVVLSSTAGFTAYEGGGGYVAAKHAEHSIAATLRLELAGDPVRVCEIAPGMVRTEEFALNRLGSADKAESVYAGVAEPLVADDVAESIAWVLERPRHVNVDLMVLRPLAQAAQHKVVRRG